MAIVTGGSQLLDPIMLLEVELGLGAGMTMAAFGVGSSAHFVIPAAKIVGPEGRVYGIDVMKAYLSSLEHRATDEGLANVIPVWADLEVYGSAKDIVDHSVDCLTMINLLSLTRQDEHVLNEANRLLKKLGRILVVDWASEGTKFGPPAEQRTSLDKVRQMAKVLQWKETQTFQPSPYHFGLVFEKQ